MDEATLGPYYKAPDPYGWLTPRKGCEVDPDSLEGLPVPERHAIAILSSFEKEGRARQGAYMLPVLFDPDYGRLNLAEREFIGVVVSAVNHCITCLIVHTHLLGEHIGDHGRARRIGINYRQVTLSSRERAIADFCVKLTSHPGHIERADMQALQNEGLDDETIYYVVELAGLFNMTNRTTAAYGMRPDDEFMRATAPVRG
ncbi:peroxidase-related enzyme [Sphingobium sp. CR2-8]|uniref:peroxidase-related enzyme n=1 Tax=Sphingobium sp. CR2-8 TaxID=1306534 RepID=UPI002DB6A063|nr:peroxidase-related enzyme [Sphingobium sp. CR2-8]MEC3909517.1 peroxidase-related enzyme [Sphingobium sp. CR2-8]